MKPILLLLALPLLEIAVFIFVGSHIGVLPTIALIILTGIGGGILLRIQGLGALTSIRQQMEAGANPGREIVHGAMILLAGFLLLIPGFVTDLLGILMFIPAVRDVVWRLVRSRIQVFDVFVARRGGMGGGRTIDLDEEEYTKERDDSDPASPWRRLERDDR